jgi:hypothetical protein
MKLSALSTWLTIDSPSRVRATPWLPNVCETNKATGVAGRQVNAPKIEGTYGGAGVARRRIL